MGPAEFLDVVEHAILNAPRGRRGRRAIVLTLHLPTGSLWGEQGHPMGPDDQGRPTYGFTAVQATRLRNVVLDACREPYQDAS